MKKVFVLIFLVPGCLGMLSAQSNYYWYKGEKIPLETITSKKYLLFESVTDGSAMRGFSTRQTMAPERI